MTAERNSLFGNVAQLTQGTGAPEGRGDHFNGEVALKVAVVMPKLWLRLHTKHCGHAIASGNFSIELELHNLEIDLVG